MAIGSKNQWLIDLDKDGSFELIFVSRCSGSGGYAKLFVYSIVGKKLIKRKMPSYALPSYSGKEQIWIQEKQLMVGYPLYDPKDTNSNPTGSRVVLIFDVKKKKWKDEFGNYIGK